jgi:RNA polymerase sigma-70 factor (ECF subfamily)
MDSAFRLEQVNGPADDGQRPVEIATSAEVAEDAPDVGAPAVADGDQHQESEAMSSVAAQDTEVRPLELAEHDEVEAPSAQPVGVAQFDALFTRYQTPICNYLYRLVGNREQAFDLAQDVFVKAYRALAAGTTIQPGALSSWLYRIASNTATDYLRRRKLIAWLPLSLFNDDRGIGAGMPGSDGEDAPAQTPALFSSAASYDGGRFEQHVADREMVQRVLDQLPPKYATCLLLYEYEGFSCTEIATMLEITPSAVKMRLMRARERFIHLYQQEVAGT